MVAESETPAKGAKRLRSEAGASLHISEVPKGRGRANRRFAKPEQDTQVACEWDMEECEPPASITRVWG